MIKLRKIPVKKKKENSAHNQKKTRAETEEISREKNGKKMGLCQFQKKIAKGHVRCNGSKPGQIIGGNFAGKTSQDFFFKSLQFKSGMRAVEMQAGDVEALSYILGLFSCSKNTGLKPTHICRKCLRLLFRVHL